MTDLIWQKIKPWGEADDTTYWIAGIYKITSYRDGEYHAYFIQDHCNNWGDHVSTPPDNGSFGKCWNSIDKAIEACQTHSKKHSPTKVTIKRADEIKTSLIQQEKENNA
ncbi:hypothetical protein [Dyadobacter sp. CY356]|uniref:hypothetical protein n=1 Tax=Dyadobacter sp. CY356 TaxID=2906442 RepID=UPI001F22CC98|nr:hypothetical protein [Dyadobacter sp. CY356]MCF0055499.1 hypothetical protein [Dyadobacter sp. CY356]